jgi:hypothetical protein
MATGRRKPSATTTSKRTRASRRRSPEHRDALVPLEAALVAFADLAKRLRLRWYVFGAQAVNLLGYPRATADLDVTVDLGDRDPMTFAAALEKAGFELRFSDGDFITATRVIPVVHLATALPVDVVLAGPGLEQQFLDEVIIAKLDGRKIPLLSRENLIVTKVIAGRDRDLEDVRELLARAPQTDHAKVELLLDAVDEALGTAELVARYRRLRS